MAKKVFEFREFEFSKSIFTRDLLHRVNQRFGSLGLHDIVNV